MSVRMCLLVLGLAAILPTRVVTTANNYGIELVLSKLDLLQYKIQELEQTFKSNPIDPRQGNSQLVQQNGAETKDDYVRAKLETLERSMKEIENALKARDDSLLEMARDIKELERSLITDESTRVNVEAKLDEMERNLVKRQDVMEEKLLTLEKTLVSKISNIEVIYSAQNNSCSEEWQKNNKPPEPTVPIVSSPILTPDQACRQAAVKVTGIYLFQIEKNAKPSKILCEQTKFGGGWTVIQHRFNGSVDFYRNWTDYRNGFGSLDGEFWLGLELVHRMTKRLPHELLVEMEDFHGNYGYARYDEFQIGSESDKYELKKLGKFSGTAGDSMSLNRYEAFSTFDRDNDEDFLNCAMDRHGAWWYWECTNSNLNGRYQNEPNDRTSMNWLGLQNDNRGLSFSRMMIRPIKFD